MKRNLIAAALLFAGAADSAFAEPLQPKNIAADAKWLVHLDLDMFRATRLGEFVSKEIVDKQLTKLAENGKLAKTEEDINSFIQSQGGSAAFRKSGGFSFRALIDKIHSVTAYGSDFSDEPDRNGVLILKVDPQIQQVATALLIQQSYAAENGGEAPVQRLTEGDHEMFSIDGELLVSLQGEGQVLASKSRERLKAARKALAGEGQTLSSTQTLAGYPPAANGFFFLAVAQGFADNENIPPQAKILQQAQGARVVLGEKEENLFLNLNMKAKTAEGGSQIRQVIQGMSALLALSQPENQDLQTLSRSLNISGEDKTVSLSLKFPVQGALKKASEAVAAMDEKRTAARLERAEAELKQAQAELEEARKELEKAAESAKQEGQ